MSPDIEIDLSHLSQKARHVIELSRKEAERFNQSFVGTEHLLLGLIKLGEGVAIAALRAHGLDPQAIRIDVEREIGTVPDQKRVSKLRLTPRVRKVLVLAEKVAKGLQSDSVDTEHILLGILDEGDGLAARVLLRFGINPDNVRQFVIAKDLNPAIAVRLPGSQRTTLQVGELLLLTADVIGVPIEPKPMSQAFAVELSGVRDSRILRFTFVTEDQVNAFVQGLEACCAFHGKDVRLPKLKLLDR